MMKNSNPIRSRLVTWTVLALAVALVLPSAFAARRHHLAPRADKPSETGPQVLGVVVMSRDPGDLLRMDRRGYARVRYGGEPVFGPFVGPDAKDVWVVAVYDRRQLDGPFDQVTRFILPDGHLYETRTTPVDPAALPGTEVDRSDLAQVPVEVQPVRRLRRVARMLPAGTVRGNQMRNATYTRVRLPVSGTWITRHNLYGTWKVEVETWQDGKLVSSSSTSFVVRNR